MNNNQTVEELEARVMTTTGGSNSHQHAKPYYADGLDQNYHRKYLVRSAGHVEYLMNYGYENIPECFCEECVIRRQVDSEGH